MKKLSKLLIILALLASPWVMALPLQDWVGHATELRGAALRLGHTAPLVFFLAAVLATLVGLPRLIFCSLGGWLFGLGWGFALSHFGTLIGAYGMFLMARHSRPERLLARFPRLRSMALPHDGHGWWTVFLIRQLPIGGLYNDVLLGWSRVGTRDFWIGSFLGFLPQGLLATLVGAGAVPALSEHASAYLALAAAALLLFSGAARWLAGRRCGDGLA